jgi:hypothetical protein
MIAHDPIDIRFAGHAEVAWSRCLPRRRALLHQKCSLSVGRQCPCPFPMRAICSLPVRIRSGLRSPFCSMTKNMRSSSSAVAFVPPARKYPNLINQTMYSRRGVDKLLRTASRADAYLNDWKIRLCLHPLQKVRNEKWRNEKLSETLLRRRRTPEVGAGRWRPFHRRSRMLRETGCSGHAQGRPQAWMGFD